MEGVGTRGQFYEKIKNIIIGILFFKLAQGVYWNVYPDGDGTFDLIFSFMKFDETGNGMFDK